MGERCIHLRAAVIAEDAKLFDGQGVEHRGNVRWCTQCGAILPLIAGVSAQWSVPDSAETMSAYQHSLEQDAAAAGRARGKGRAHG